MLLSSVPMRKLEAWERRKPRGLKQFTYWYLISFLSARENNLLLSLLRNGSSLIYSSVFCRFRKVLFESEVLFQKYQNKLQGSPKPVNLSFRNMKSFQPPILIQKTEFSTTKVEVTKPDLRRIQTSLVTEDAIVNLSPVFKWLEDKAHLDHGQLKNNILKWFRWPILNGNETVCSKHYFLEK